LDHDEQGSGSLDIVIVSFRCESLLRDCLASLRRHPASVPTTVRVIDNASRDGTAEMVVREYPEVELTVNQRNRGFAAATNQGLRAGRSRFALVLNPDTRVMAGALDTVLAALERDGRIGIAGPRLALEDGSFDHAAKRSFPTPISALGHFAGVGRRRGARGPLAAYRAPDVDSGEVDAVNGAFMLIRRSALDEVGLFDEGYWMYMEDLDLSYRMKQAGWPTWFEPSAEVIHVKGGTSGPVRSPRLEYAFHYGMWRFYRKHYAAGRGRVVNATIYAGIAAKLAWAVFSAPFRRLSRGRAQPRAAGAGAGEGVSPGALRGRERAAHRRSGR
jgi:GT2 family glycosyltransferase